MPMEASMNIGIRPVDRPQSTGGVDGVSRREDGGGSSAAFSPKTNVSIKNAVDDMAGILSKIASNQTEAVDKMPEELQKVIQNVLKQAFSLEETMGQGLGSTLESQRFSMDQLTALSRMLSQLGNMAEKGMPVEVSDEMRALLTNLKAMVSSESGSSLEPVLLTKAAFELLDKKTFAELPKEVQELLLALQPQGQAVAMNTGNGNAMEFLKQLVQYFMPRPAAGTGQAVQQQEQPQQAQQGTAQQGQTGQNAARGQQSAGQETARGNVGQDGNAQRNNVPQTQNSNVAGQNLLSPQGKLMGNSPAAQQTPQGQQGQNAQAGQNGQPGQAGQSGAQQTGNAQGQNLAQANGNPAQQGQNGRLTGSGTMTNQPGQQAQTAGTQNGTVLGQNTPQADASKGNPQAADMQGRQESLANGQKAATGNPQQAAIQQAKAQLMSQTMENTQQAMSTMRDLAQLLMKNTEMSQRDVMLLQNFVNGKSGTLSEQDAKQLQQLIRLCQQNVPATVQQAAYQQDIPDLPRLWAFMQLCDMTIAKRMSARQLKKAGKDVATFVLSMRNSMEGGNSTVQGQRSLNFMLPMYMGDDTTYPSYIHVYDERQPDPETGERKKETWLRLCVLTDNIGAVELTCRVYQENQLDMRVFFSDQASADVFRQEAKALRDSLKDSALQLKDFKIGATGERRFM